MSGAIHFGSHLFGLALAFAKTGVFTFGSGYAMLSLMQKEIVEKHSWLNAEQFADLVAIAEVTPGPITVNMATFVGFRVAGIAGAITATLGLITGPMIAILLVVRYYATFRHNVYVDAAFRGLRPAVLALILYAVINLGKSSVVDTRTAAVFAASLALLHFANIYPLYVAVLGIAFGIAFFR